LIFSKIVAVSSRCWMSNGSDSCIKKSLPIGGYL
jgi:hypothetical protein